MTTQRNSRNPADPHRGSADLGGRPAPEAATAHAHPRARPGGLGGEHPFALEELGLDGLAALAPQARGLRGTRSRFSPHWRRTSHTSTRRLHRLDVGGDRSAVAGHSEPAIAILGFSQGASPAEYVAQHPRRYGAAMGLSGGLIGPPGHQGISWHARRHAGVPGSSDPDPTCHSSGCEGTRGGLDAHGRQGSSSAATRACPIRSARREPIACRNLLRDLMAV